MRALFGQQCPMSLLAGIHGFDNPALLFLLEENVAHYVLDTHDLMT